MMVRKRQHVAQPVPVEVAFRVKLPREWSDHALCRTGDPNDWYPPMYTSNGVDTGHVASLKRVCGRCPVRLACLIDALQAEGVTPATGRDGVKGGMRPDERADAYKADWATMVKAQRKGIPPCGPAAGSAVGVKRHREAREELCWPCRQYKDAGRVPVSERQREAVTG